MQHKHPSRGPGQGGHTHVAAPGIEAGHRLGARHGAAAAGRLIASAVATWLRPVRKGGGSRRGPQPGGELRRRHARSHPTPSPQGRGGRGGLPPRGGRRRAGARAIGAGAGSVPPLVAASRLPLLAGRPPPSSVAGRLRRRRGGLPQGLRRAIARAEAERIRGFLRRHATAKVPSRR